MSILNIKKLFDLAKLSRRDFLKGTGATVGAGLIGSAKFAKTAKKVKDLDINFKKDVDAEQDMDGAYDYSSNLYALIKPYTEKAKKLLNKLKDEGKVQQDKDGDFMIEVNDIDSPSLSALEEIKDLKYDVNKLDYVVNPKTNQIEETITKIDDLRKNSDDNPLFYQSAYGPGDSFESEASEYAIDILQPKSVKEVIEERAKKKSKGFYQGGIASLEGIR